MSKHNEHKINMSGIGSIYTTRHHATTGKLLRDGTFASDRDCTDCREHPLHESCAASDAPGVEIRPRSLDHVKE